MENTDPGVDGVGRLAVVWGPRGLAGVWWTSLSDNPESATTSIPDGLMTDLYLSTNP
jgi:hypothetical protein